MDPNPYEAPKTLDPAAGGFRLSAVPVRRWIESAVVAMLVITIVVDLLARVLQVVR